MRQPTAGERIADDFGEIVRRESRAVVYGELTAGLGPALHEATYPVLSGLARGGPRSAARLGHDIGLDRSVVSRHADRLQSAGLLRREPDPADKRASLLVLTGEGERVVVRMRARLAERFDTYLAHWPAEEAEAFARALRRFTHEALLPRES
jgi:DNA-binding MarR family transcriptional regulator